jgi:hypothetical protein
MIHGLTIFIYVLIAANCFVLFGLFSSRASFLEQYPKFNKTTLTLFTLLPVVNLISLGGLFFYQLWAVYLFAVCSLLVIFSDIYFGVKSHLAIAAVSSLILTFLIFQNFSSFK